MPKERLEDIVASPRAQKMHFFPFSGIVGQERAKLALLCVAANPLIGGVLLRGDKGTGKSTLVRALANILPRIEVVADCPFNCNPREPLEMCDDCRAHFEGERELEASWREMKVVDLPLSVTVDRLVGTVSVEDFLREGKKALQPGILAEANRNILYIDEVNLLDDYIADSLLDAAAMGWNIIEREGISFRHPARFILIGSMNPEEGELRPQILDRFGLCVEISAPMNLEERIEIVKRVEQFHKDPIGFCQKYEDEERRLTERIVRAKELLPMVKINDDLLRLLTETVIKLNIKTNRAEIATVKTAKTMAALDGRRRVSLEDLERAIELTLPHRLREKPFQKPPQMRPPQSAEKPLRPEEGKPKHNKREENRKEPGNPELQRQGNLEQNFPSEGVRLREIERLNFRGEARYRSSREASVTVINFPKGIQVSHVPPKGEGKDVDFYSSAVCAVLNGKRPPVRLDTDDIQVRVRKAKVPTLWVLILDSSGSMAVGRRINVAKGIAQSLVENGYVKKSKMALIVARGTKAEVFVRPTKNYHEVFEKIEGAPTGGKTPLSSALYNLLLLAEREWVKDKTLKVRAFLVTDGRANVSFSGKGIGEEIAELGRAVRKKGIELSIFDTNGKGMNLGLSYIPLLGEEADARIIVVPHRN